MPSGSSATPKTARRWRNWFRSTPSRSRSSTPRGRWSRRCPCSLNERFEEEEEGRSVERAEKLDQEDYLLRIGVEPRAAEELRALALDVAAVVENLPSELHELCRRLGQETVSEISRDTGVPRATLYQSVTKLREIFEDAGLKDYL